MNKCKKLIETQKWMFDTFNPTKIKQDFKNQLYAE